MRPLALRMRSFGPFAREEKIDFRPALHTGFVLIHGRTGAGKSTILDAICHALYATTATDGRPMDRMRAQLAESTSPTELALDFEVRGAAYRVHRRPPWERPRLRGEGTTLAPGEATLWNRTECTSDDQEGRPIATGDTRVTEAVQRLLGFNADQFRQVILLPQGKVREFLIAGSQDREEVLKVLFGTQRFEDLANLLKARRNELARTVQATRDNANAVLETVGAESHAALFELGKVAAREVKETEAKASELKVLVDGCARTLSEAEALNAQFEELAAANQELVDSQQRVTGLVELEAELARAKAAQAVEPALILAKTREEERVLAEDREMGAGESVRLASREAADARENLKRAAQTAGSRDEMAAECARLEALIPVAEALAKARRELTDREAQSTKAEETSKQARERMMEAEAEGARNATRLLELQEAAASVGTRQGELDRIRAWRKLLVEIALADATRAGVAAALEQAESSSIELEQEAATALATMRELRARWTHGRAAALASELVPNSPCPVCGSLDHPAPASSGANAATDEQVERAEEALRSASDAAASAQANLAGKRAEDAAAAREAARVKGLLETEFPALGRSDPHKTELEAERVLGTARRAAKDLDAVRQREAALRDVLPRLREASDSARTHAEETRSLLLSAGRAVEMHAAQVPEDSGDVVSIRARIKALRDDVARRDADLRSASERSSKADREEAGAIVGLENATRNAEEAREALARANTALAAAMAGGGFASRAACEAARRDAEALVRNEREILTVKEQAASARTRLDRAMAAVAGKDRPNMESTRASLVSARQVAAETDSKHGAARERLAMMRKIATQAKALAEEEAAAQRELDAVGPLANAVDGKAPNQTGINLQRWILGAMFDDVLVDATQRLKELSRGRYRLHRAVERKHKGQAFGLDLEVEDAWTGLSRPVATLSGGESFQAALALALGLADSVQRQAGGIEMGTLFIDEGFGSLDRESLDDAIDLLRSLRLGNRLVGIVSHVAELQGLIDTRLEVVAGTTGSHTRWHTP